MQYISSFYKHLEYERRYSQHTIVTYKCDLSQFCSFLESENIVRWDNVSSKTIRSWMVKLLNDGKVPVTIHRKISALKSFFRYLMREQILESNPVEGVVVPKKPKRLPVFVKEKEMDELLDVVPFGNDFNGI